MLVSKEFKGKTIDDALSNALFSLSKDRDDVTYEVLERPKNGFLGFGRVDALIKVTYEDGVKDEPVKKAPPAPRPAQPQQPPKSFAPKPVAKPAEAPKVENKPVQKPAQRPPQPQREKTDKPLEPRPPRPQQSGEPKKPQQPREQRPQPPRQREPGAPGSEPQKTQRPPRQAVEPKGDEHITAENFVKGVLGIMGIDASTVSSVDAKDGTINVEIKGENMGFVIGRRGETLDALQYLATIVTNKTDDSRWRVALDTENYREKRTQALISLAHKTASQVARTGKSISLEPMNPQERRIIHAALQDSKTVTTFSTGSEPRRKIVVAPQGAKKTYKPAPKKDEKPVAAEKPVITE